MDGVGSGPQMAFQELGTTQHGLPQACPPPLVPSQPSPATAQPSLGAQEGPPGGLCPDLSPAATQRLGHKVGASVGAGQGCSPWTPHCGDSQDTHSGSLIMSPVMAAAPFYGQMAQEV